MDEELFRGVDAKVYPTYACSGGCPFCLTDIRPRIRELDREEFLANFASEIERYYAHGGRRVLFTGGEPTQATDKLLGMLDIISEKQYAFELIVLYTNGIHLFDQVGEGTLLALLATKGLQAICLSVHSDLQAERMRLSPVIGALDVEAVIRGVLATNMSLRLNCTLLKDYVGNLARVKRYLNWAASLGVREVYFRDLFHISNRGRRTTPGDQRKLAYTDAARIDFNDIVESAMNDQDFRFQSCMKRHREWGTTHLFTHVPTGIQTYFGTLEIGAEREGETTYFAINPNGLMTPNMNASE